MPGRSSVFKSPESEAEYNAAYDATLAAWPVPYQSLCVPTRAGLTHAIVSGPEDAPPLVLLPMTFISATMWMYNVADLGRRYRVYALDTVGDLGKSLPAGPMSSRADIAGWLSDAFDGLGVESAFLAGASYGGCMAMGFALDAPERVKRLALLGPAATFVPLRFQFYLRGASIVMLPRRSVLYSFLRWCSTRSDLVDNPIIRQMHAGVRNYKFQPQNGLFPPVYSDDELRGVKMPVLLLV
ncbi:MAG TPA: alpha/beta fold hydrolase, partial [Methanocella sp.]|nr:alpha/beta fold hydrolase [Methanocella sp.]